MKLGVFFEAARAAEKIGLNPNNRNQVKLVQIPDKHSSYKKTELRVIMERLIIERLIIDIFIIERTIIEQTIIKGGSCCHRKW